MFHTSDWDFPACITDLCGGAPTSGSGAMHIGDLIGIRLFAWLYGYMLYGVYEQCD